jgi:hypothetical protein
MEAPPLETFLDEELKPLSLRATRGFWSRALESKEIAWAPEFMRSLGVYMETVHEYQVA